MRHLTFRGYSYNIINTIIPFYCKFFTILFFLPEIDFPVKTPSKNFTISVVTRTEPILYRGSSYVVHVSFRRCSWPCVGRFRGLFWGVMSVVGRTQRWFSITLSLLSPIFWVLLPTLNHRDGYYLIRTPLFGCSWVLGSLSSPGYVSSDPQLHPWETDGSRRTRRSSPSLRYDLPREYVPSTRTGGVMD